MQITLKNKTTTNSQITYKVEFEVLDDNDKKHKIITNITVISDDVLACPEIYTEIIKCPEEIEQNEELIGEIEKCFLRKNKTS